MVKDQCVNQSGKIQLNILIDITLIKILFLFCTILVLFICHLELCTTDHHPCIMGAIGHLGTYDVLPRHLTLYQSHMCIDSYEYNVYCSTTMDTGDRLVETNGQCHTFTH